MTATPPLAKKREPIWDNYKAVLIFLVVLGHFLYTYGTKISGSLAHDIVLGIYFFHMPAFVFISGFFSKSESCKKAPACLKLIICYLLFNTAMMFIQHYLFGGSLKLFTPYYSYWYILSLLSWRLMLIPLQGIGKKRVFVISILIALVVGFWDDVPNLLSLRRTIAFFPFFFGGYMLSKDFAGNLLSFRKRYRLVSVVAFIGFVALCAALYYAVNNYSISTGMLMANAYSSASGVKYRVFVYVVATVAIALLFFAMPQMEIPLVTAIGKNSLLIYLAHRFVTFAFTAYLPLSGYSRAYLVYALIASIITCVVFGNAFVNKYFNQGLGWLSGVLLSNEQKGQVARTCFLLIILAVLCLRPFIS